MTEQIVAEQSAPPQPVTALDGVLLKRLFQSGTAWLEHNVDYVNRLNVFPVPDGDTGTNMLLTMRSAMREAGDTPSHAAHEVAAKVAQGALMGARGNSGVILSQLLRGFSRAIEGKPELTTHDIAHAFQHASDMAYKAVMKPVEGTILTVGRAAAEESVEAADETDDICEQQERVVRAAKKALARTPELLPVLKEAGVVDSGGQGLVAILEGMLRYLNGDVPAKIHETTEDEIDEVMGAPPQPFENGQYGYDIQFLIRGDDLDVDGIRDFINGIGDCALVVGEPTLVKVHVHCLNPGPALDFGAQHGMLDDIVVENMDLQYQEFVGGNQHTPPQRKSSEPAPVTTDAVVGIGTIVVAPSTGLKRIFESLGASKIIAGGQTMNPSTQDILDAIDKIEADIVIVLPNNKNIIMAAQQAQAMSPKAIHIVPTQSIPQGIAAMMSINYTADIDTNLENMNGAIEHVITAEITEAVRTTKVDGVEVTEGDLIGLLDGKLVAAGDDVRAVAHDLLTRIDLGAYEIVTFFYGEDVSEREAHELVAGLTADFDALEFDVLEGGQPHYRYIFSIE